MPSDHNLQTNPLSSRPLRRSLLFMPGDSMRKIEKAAGLDVDSIIMDLEDGTALNRKVDARETVVQALKTLDFGPRERLVRLNPLRSTFFGEDLQSTIAAKPDGYVIPKVEEPQDLLTISALLSEHERAYEWPSGTIRLLAVIETALGIMNLCEIAQAAACIAQKGSAHASDNLDGNIDVARVDALMFGAEDLAGDIGATRTLAGQEILYARSAVVTAAAAYGLQAIDTVFVDLTDLDSLAAECRFVQEMGYTGKMAIHPRQVPVIQQTFSPTPEDLARAQLLIKAHDEHQAAGAGAFEFEGKMVDMPVVRAAEQVLARARRIGT